MTPTNDSSREPQLCPDDQRLLDALIDAGFDRTAVGQLNNADSRRMDALVKMLGLMRDYPVEDAEDALIDATLARINRVERDRVERMRIENQRQAGARGAWEGRRFRVPDFITVAAVLLIAVSVMWPVLSQIHKTKIDRACADNMRQLGYAFGNYAADYNEALPMAAAGFASWDHVSNALNLNKLVEGGYCDREHLNCPGHDELDHLRAGPSYSYRWFVPGAPIRWGTSPRMTVVMGDLNPVIDAARSGIYVPPLTMSPNHAGRGQFVLLTDASTMWLDRPIVGSNDNIWLPSGATQLRLGFRPEDPFDVFLAH
jgi:hypothetical protein